MNSRTASRRTAGFTLVEAVMAIAITGIIGGMVAVFIKAPVEGYFDSVRRADLTDAADAALRRIARDVRTALPNSLRTTDTQCLEFLPVAAGGRYRAAANGAGSGNVFDFTTTGAFNVDVLANDGLGSLPAGAHHFVVYNLGIKDADAYNADNRRQISSVSGASPTMTIGLAAGAQFPLDSPGKRFQVIPNYSVVYSCPGDRKLYRSTRAITASPLTTCPSGGTVLVDNVTACTFGYTPAVQRSGLLALTLTLTRSEESVRLYQEVLVSNVP